MKRVWISGEQKIQPSFVAHLVEDFLREKGFRTRTEDVAEESFRVLAVSRSSEGKRTVMIDVKRVEEGIEVNFKSGEIEKKLMKSGSLMSLLGAGALIVNYGKKLDFYETVENELWRHLKRNL